MADKSAIEWTDATWNPIRARNRKTGKVGWHCEHATTGCEFCYAEGFNLRLGTGLPFKPGHRKDIELFLDEEMLTQPLRWKKPRLIFPCSMTDLFADFVPVEWIDKIFAVMALAPQHTFQVLTKRAARLRDYMTLVRVKMGDEPLGSYECIYNAMGDLGRNGLTEPHPYRAAFPNGMPWPLPNVWLGVSTERQHEADERIPLLLQTPAAVRFISAEPLLGPIDLESAWHGESALDSECWGDCAWCVEGHPPLHNCRNEESAFTDRSGIDWVIAGGESGPKARPTHPDWVRTLEAQCREAQVPFFFKQWGEWLPWSQFNSANVEDNPEQTRFATREWDDGAWEDVGRPMWCDVSDGNVDDEQCVGRVGKAKAGRKLDSKLHDTMPARPAS